MLNQYKQEPGLKNFWLNRRNWHSFDKGLLGGIDKKYSRATCAILLESCRLQYEVGNDEEYAAYLKEFRERTQKALDANRSQ